MNPNEPQLGFDKEFGVEQLLIEDLRSRTLVFDPEVLGAIGAEAAALTQFLVEQEVAAVRTKTAAVAASLKVPDRDVSLASRVYPD